MGLKNSLELKPFAMFAVNTELDQTAELVYVESTLGCNVKQVVGCYKGNQETSYIVTFSRDDSIGNMSKINRLFELCRKNSQESVLMVDSKREARLFFLNINSTQGVGTFQRATPAEAIELGNWTLDGNQFWICK